jgi:DNA-binding winged helix-turn-helix (wHTH) protein
VDGPAAIRFGRFEARPAERRLLVDGRPATLGARAWDLLQALIERRDRVVGKSELLDLVWPGLVVEEGNLHVQTSTLRKVLGDGVIATVPGRGYRFVAPLDGDRRPPADPASAAARPQPRPPRSRRSAGMRNSPPLWRPSPRIG